MGTVLSDAVRDTLAEANPHFASVIRARDKVIKDWCKQHSANQDTLTESQLKQIRATKAWKKASQVP